MAPKLYSIFFLCRNSIFLNVCLSFSLIYKQTFIDILTDNPDYFCIYDYKLPKLKKILEKITWETYVCYHPCYHKVFLISIKILLSRDVHNVHNELTSLASDTGYLQLDNKYTKVGVYSLPHIYHFRKALISHTNYFKTKLKFNLRFVDDATFYLTPAGALYPWRTNLAEQVSKLTKPNEVYKINFITN